MDHHPLGRSAVLIPVVATPCLSRSSRSARSSSSLTITFDVISSNIAYLEHVVVPMTINVLGYSITYSISSYKNIINTVTSEEELIDWLQSPHPRRGDIKVDLTAPSGTTSHLLPYRRYDFINNEGYSDWPFMSVHHWGENPIGQWTLTVSFKSSSGYASVSNVSMKLYGVDVTNPGTDVTTHPTLSDTVKHALIGVFSFVGLVLIIGVLVSVVLYCARRAKRSTSVQFRTISTEVGDDKKDFSSVPYVSV